MVVEEVALLSLEMRASPLILLLSIVVGVRKNSDHVDHFRECDRDQGTKAVMIKAFLRNISWQVLQGRSVLISMFDPNGDGLAVIRGF